MSDREQFCTFHLGQLFLGVRVQDVQEVIRYQDLTRVPLAPATVRGLINLRGQIVTAIDLRKRFGLPDRSAESLPMNVVVRTDDGPVSLLVDEIGDVLEVSGDLWEAPPETLSDDARALVRGVYKLEGRLLLELDGVRALEPVAAS
ncbi:MAG: chemotaxis protein CheW [Planctomycetes bacterium]|nr:chemotaxis protein CheW [Planctomycetota bacterium]